MLTEIGWLSWFRARDQSQVPPLQRVLFIEKQREFKWHPGMLLPNSRMQIRFVPGLRSAVGSIANRFCAFSFLKDLATLRSPQSPITFLNYLHSQDRLLNFINRGSFTPTRKEFADYLTWAAEYVRSQGIKVRYGEEVVAITRRDDGLVEVRSRDTVSGEEFCRRGRKCPSYRLPGPSSWLTAFRQPCDLAWRFP